MDRWIQSLRAPSPTRIRTGREKDAALNTRRSAFAASLPPTENLAIGPTKPRLASALDTNSGSKARRSASVPSATRGRTLVSTQPRLDSAVNTNAAYPPNKCPNLCCDDILEQPATFAQSCSKAVVESEQTATVVQSWSEAVEESRLRYRVDSSETALIMDQISRAEALHTAYENELTRLKCIVSGRPPPPTLAVLRNSTSCAHACCSPKSYPPSHASSEWSRLRRIMRQLQLRYQEILQYLKAKRRLLAPIRRLPPELLEEVFLFAQSEIFKLYPSSAASDRDYYNFTSLPKVVGAIRFAHVCSHWRAVALNSGRLWATILLRLTGISGIKELDFKTSHAKSTPLTIICHTRPAPQILAKLALQCHRWRNLTDHVGFDWGKFDLKEFDAIYQRIPLLRSLFLRYSSWRDITVFRDAPSLRRVVLTNIKWPSKPFSFIWPWTHLTFLTLAPLAFPLFSECLRQCPRLLYFKVEISSREPAEPPQVTETHGSLRKLVVHGAHCEAVILPHDFPHLVSLSIEMDALHSRFFAFLARSSCLQMLSMSGKDIHPSDCFQPRLSSRPHPCAFCTSENQIGQGIGTRW
ncbi:hypothetical protein K438DRAFT_321155 [Mycena galopus ATCC 62051]|nr:hypothetical protein K438DRAFT_321155 [Mycena galopus ATCC 62051]